MTKYLFIQSSGLLFVFSVDLMCKEELNIKTSRLQPYQQYGSDTCIWSSGFGLLDQLEHTKATNHPFLKFQ